MLKFLNYVIDEKYPQTLYLFSDENMDWLREDPKFLNEWASLMFQVFKQGNKINIIHTVTRNLDEMLIAIKGWMPFYFTGAIESYYYPKKRDGIFQRTLFIAPKIVAIESTSVGDMVEDAPNILTYDNKAIQGFKKEYMNYLSLCKPLIQVYGANMKWQYYKNITEFESKVADSIIKSNGLSILTMPESLIESIVKRISNENAENVINIYKSRVDYIKKNIENNIYIEILSIPTIDQVLNGEVRVKLLSFTVGEDVFYSIDEYKLHLENIINLLTSLDNYHLHLYEEKCSQDYSFYIKEGIGMFMWSQSNPNVAIKVEENNIVAAFWDYIKFELNIDQIEVKNKIKTINRLKNIINEL
ncbi:MAG: hypothetical protein RIN55_09205 [Tissierellaceae bacterium]|nr:hypothetical protein [Tissierellaceae bacterium]